MDISEVASVFGVTVVPLATLLMTLHLDNRRERKRIEREGRAAASLALIQAQEAYEAREKIRTRREKKVTKWLGKLDSRLDHQDLCIDALREEVRAMHQQRRKGDLGNGRALP